MALNQRVHLKRHIRNYIQPDAELSRAYPGHANALRELNRKLVELEDALQDAFVSIQQEISTGVTTRIVGALIGETESAAFSQESSGELTQIAMSLSGSDVGMNGGGGANRLTNVSGRPATGRAYAAVTFKYETSESWLSVLLAKNGIAIPGAFAAYSFLDAVFSSSERMTLNVESPVPITLESGDYLSLRYDANGDTGSMMTCLQAMIAFSEHTL